MDDSHNRSTLVISIYHPTLKTFTRLTSQETDFELGKLRFDAVPLRPDSVTILRMYYFQEPDPCSSSATMAHGTGLWNPNDTQSLGSDTYS